MNPSGSPEGKKNNINPNVLEGAWKTNIEVRPEKDWENFESAVSKNQTKFDSINGDDISGCGHDHV